MLTTVKPVSPEDVKQNSELRRKHFPVEVLLAFNELITIRFDGWQSSFSQKEVEDLIIKKMTEGRSVKGSLRDSIHKNKWLDVEFLYSEQGWKVEYDKPGYNEQGEASFTFKPKKH